ncbi:MAG: haloacid dehalogenase type II [Candidatus Korobacteraceae bacterium]|jgi:2-haloacid dehalogenase
MNGVKALLFDVFGTVVDWRSGVAREATPFLVRHGVGQVDPAAFADAWRRAYQPSMEEVRSGRRAFVPLDVLHRENLERILPEFGIQSESVPAPELDELNLAWHRLDPWPDSVAGLTRLKSRYVIAPLSNGNVRLMIDIAKRSGLPWDAILGAEVVRAYKPTPEAYLRTAEVLMMKPEQLCLVAAHNDDLAAARKCGFRAAFIRRPFEHGPGQTSDLHPEQDWDHVADDLNHLVAELCG